MSGNSTMDLTTGHPLKQQLLFSLPLVAGTLFQQLYSFADTVMVGRCLRHGVWLCRAQEIICGGFPHEDPYHRF